MFLEICSIQAPTSSGAIGGCLLVDLSRSFFIEDKKFFLDVEMAHSLQVFMRWTTSENDWKMPV